MGTVPSGLPFTGSLAIRERAGCSVVAIERRDAPLHPRRTYKY
jgi:hypothetical protein